MATYTKLITREEGHIDWEKSAAEIERMSRAYNPWPGIWSFWSEKETGVHSAKGEREVRFQQRVKLLKISVLENTLEHAKEDLGRVFLNEEKLCVYCKLGAIEILELQLEGSKPQSSKEFLNGHKDFVSSLLS